MCPARRKKGFMIRQQTEVVQTLDQPESELKVKDGPKMKNNMGKGLKSDRKVSCSLLQVTNEETRGPDLHETNDVTLL